MFSKKKLEDLGRSLLENLASSQGNAVGDTQGMEYNEIVPDNVSANFFRKKNFSGSVMISMVIPSG